MCITKLDSRLDPGVEVMLLLLFQLFAHLAICVPVQACEQVVVELFACQPGGSLPLGLLSECALDLPAGCLEVKVLC